MNEGIQITSTSTAIPASIAMAVPTSLGEQPATVVIVTQNLASGLPGWDWPDTVTLESLTGFANQEDGMFPAFSG
jgi:hypothetical protein